MKKLSALMTVLVFGVLSGSAWSDSGPKDQLRQAALKSKQSKPAYSESSAVSRVGALVFNITINRKTGAPAAPFYCGAGAIHLGACLEQDGEGYCTFYEEYELGRQVQATGTANTYSCSVRLNYNFPNGDSEDYVYPYIEVLHRNSTTGFPTTSSYSWRPIKPVLLPSAASTVFNVSVDQ
jgi:hypothetical protein